MLSNITRRQFESAELGGAIQPHLVICQDEMTEAVDAEAFQKRLWDMFPWSPPAPMTVPQIDRVRWHLQPEIRIDAPPQDGLFDDPVPDVIRIMDLQQELLARSLGEGHRCDSRRRGIR